MTKINPVPALVDVISQFKNAMLAAGIAPPDDIIPDGKRHRFPTDGTKSDDAGWYVLHTDGIAAGAFGDWRTDQTHKWHIKLDRTLTRIERQAYKAKLKEMRDTRVAEDIQRKQRAAEIAAELLDASVPAEADHPYLTRKKLLLPKNFREIEAATAAKILGYTPKAKGIALAGRLLVIPVMIDNTLSTCELIDGDGRKSALFGGAKASGYWSSQALPDGDGAGLTLLIGEGVATVLSAIVTSIMTAIAALCAGNLMAVAKIMRERYPAATIIIAADLVKTTGKPDLNAVAAARAIGGVLAVPEFSTERDAGDNDFNDMACRMGDEAVRDCIAQAVADHVNQNALSRNNENGAAIQVASAPAADQPTDDTTSYSYDAGTFTVSNRGVYFSNVDKDGNQQPERLICGKLKVVAKTRDASSGEWGRLLEWRDDDHVLHRWAMPMELLQTDGAEVRRVLARMGLSIAPTRSGHDLLATYLQTAPVESRARCVERLGWHGSVYVTATEAIGEEDEAIVFQNAHAIEPASCARGEVEDWTNSVARLAAGNSRLVFALSAAFAGPLLNFAGEDSGGFHFRGGSSSGKTTALKAAASVWGNPKNYPRLWRATTNGLEGLAALHNDGLLILDELSQMDPKEAGDAAYMLANGQGKTRASRVGTARKAAMWAVLFLSAGEESLTALMAKAGHKVNAGQVVRLPDIDADAGVGMGMFERLHECATPADIALAIKDAANHHYGAVGDAWLRCIVKDREKLAEVISKYVHQFVAEATSKDAAGQVLRVAQRFALVAVAGELATNYGLTGWQPHEASEAVKKCFADWLDAFGGAGNHEEKAMKAQVLAFFEKHGASRFEDIKATDDQRVLNRAGFRRTDANCEREYLVFPEAFQREVCAGFDYKKAAKVLVEAGWIKPGTDGKFQQKPRLPGMGSTRVYVFTQRMWDGE